jgi:ankyrin repeat protein
MPPRLFELLQAKEPCWLEILAASASIEDAKYVHPETKLTPLHLAVMTKDTKKNEFRVGVIRSLLQSDLTSTEVACSELGYTPLMYACSVQDLDLLEYDIPVVKLLMEYNPQAFSVMGSPTGHTALDLHIMSMSRLLEDKTMNVSCNSENIPKIRKRGNCTCLLNALLEYDLGISMWKSLELLLACNTLQIMDHVAKEDAYTLSQRLLDRRQQREHDSSPMHNGSRKFQKSFWVWDFLLAILKSEHQHTYRDVKPVPPFNALHTACQIADFPLPFLILCMRAYPAQVRTPSVIKDELPIHSVAGWEVRCKSKVARKLMTLTQLLSAHPTSAHIRNEEGKTPLSLAIETGTAWDSGIRLLLTAQKEKSLIL